MSKSKIGCLIIAIILILVIVVVIAVSSSDSKLTTAKVVYQVMGTADSVSVTYGTNSGSIEQIGEVSLSFQKELEVKYGTPLVITAQNQNDTGSVTCRIFVDGKEIQHATSEGAYVVVTCSGMAMPNP